MDESEARRGRIKAFFIIHFLILFFLSPGSTVRALEVLTPVQLASGMTTGGKPQSKCWHHEGAWWCVMPLPGGSHALRLDGDAWTPVLQLSSTPFPKSDCLPDGNVTHILLFDGASSELVSVEYASGSPGTYQLWSERPASSPVTLGDEYGCLAMDSLDRLWTAYDTTNAIEVRYSDYPYSSWSSPIQLQTGIGIDEICAVIAFPDEKIGVMWSDQGRDEFGFRMHNDADPPEVWSAQEDPTTEINESDDHINLAVDSSGDMYAVVKTSFDTPGRIVIGFYQRTAAGVWSPLHPVSYSGSRPVCVLDEAGGKLFAIYRNNGSKYRWTDIDNINFGPEHDLFIAGSDAQSTKQNVGGIGEFIVFSSQNSTAYSSKVILNDTPTPTDTPPPTHTPTPGPTFTPVEPADPPFDCWLQFLGQTGCTVPASTDFALEVFTLAAWFYPVDVTGSKAVLAHGESFDTDKFNYFLGIEEGEAYFWYEISNDADYVLQGGAVEPYQWYFIAATRNEDGDTALYLNGYPVDSSQGQPPPQTIPWHNLTIGVRTNEPDVYQDWFQGYIDAVAIYDRALSPAEIGALCAEGEIEPGSSTMGMWRFNQTEGQTIIDESDRGNDGFLGKTDLPDAFDAFRRCPVTPTPVPSGSPAPTPEPGSTPPFHCYLHLQGSHCGIIPENQDFGLETFTLTAWAYPTDTSGVRAVAAHGESFDTDKMNYLLAIQNGQAYFWYEAPNDDDYRLQGGTVSTDAWVFLAASRDADGNLQLYIDGAPVDSATGCPPPDTIPGHIFTVGVRTNQGNQYQDWFQGYIDNVVLYEHALSPTEIAGLFTAGEVVPDAGVISMWRFNRNAGQEIIDHSLNQHHGYLGKTANLDQFDPIRLCAPTPSPTFSPTNSPTFSPTSSPSHTLSPTLSPSLTPSQSPTLSPTHTPSLSPTSSATPTLPFTPTRTHVPTPPHIPASSTLGSLLAACIAASLLIKYGRKN